MHWTVLHSLHSLTDPNQYAHPPQLLRSWGMIMFIQMHFYGLCPQRMQSFKGISIKTVRVTHTRSIHNIFTVLVLITETQLRSNCEKVLIKFNLMITSKRHAHLQIMITTSVKFQRNQKKKL